MTAPARYKVVAAPTANMLCKLIGLFAQLDLPAPDLTVIVSPQRMVLKLKLTAFGSPTARIIADKMAGMVGVECVEFDGGDE